MLDINSNGSNEFVERSHVGRVYSDSTRNVLPFTDNEHIKFRDKITIEQSDKIC
jgi:hypothetical protein